MFVQEVSQNNLKFKLSFLANPVILSICVVLSFPLFAQEKAPVSLEEAVERVYAEEGGQILKATKLEKDQRTIYHIRILTALGKVKTYNIDATTGNTVN